jgi:hypothetical protein
MSSHDIPARAARCALAALAVVSLVQDWHSRCCEASAKLVDGSPTEGESRLARRRSAWQSRAFAPDIEVDI